MSEIVCPSCLHLAIELYRDGRPWREIAEVYPGSRHAIRQAASSRGYARPNPCRACGYPTLGGRALCDDCTDRMILDFAVAGAGYASQEYGIAPRTAQQIARRAING